MAQFRKPTKPFCFAASEILAGTSSHVNVEIGYASFPQASVMETRKSSGMVRYRICCGRHGGEIGFHELAALVRDLPISQMVLHRINQFDVADGAHLGDLIKPATPSLPLAPIPVGHCTEVFLPTLAFQSGLTFDR